MIKIKLNSKKYPGLFAQIDNEDFCEISKYRWWPDANHNKFYAQTEVRKKGKRMCVSMHHIIIGKREGFQIDHKDGNGLNNKKSNLRHVTSGQNKMNSESKGGISQYKGVFFIKKNKKWEAQIRKNKKLHHLGCFLSEEDAAYAYNKAAIEMFGEYARLNK